MKERPILFSAPMVRAILDGRKTQTRRIVKPQPPVDEIGRPEHGKIIGPKMFEPVAYDRHGEMFPGPEIFGAFDEDGEWGAKCPHGQPSDHLWVRENIYIDDAGNSGFAQRPLAWHVNYKADGHSEWCFSKTELKNIGNKPSIHMPRWASRITLEVTDVRVERLQQISEEDIHAEGCKLVVGEDARWHFSSLWNSLNAKRGHGWDNNPWVWCIEFKRLPTKGEGL